jgi:hypothetical protein
MLKKSERQFRTYLLGLLQRACWYRSIWSCSRCTHFESVRATLTLLYMCHDCPHAFQGNGRVIRTGERSS